MQGSSLSYGTPFSRFSNLHSIKSPEVLPTSSSDTTMLLGREGIYTELSLLTPVRRAMYSRAKPGWTNSPIILAHNNFGAAYTCYQVHVFCYHSTSERCSSIFTSITPHSLFQTLCKHITFLQTVKRGKTSQQVSHCSELTFTLVVLRSLWQLRCLNQLLSVQQIIKELTTLSHQKYIPVNITTSCYLCTQVKPAYLFMRVSFSCSHRCLDAVVVDMT